MKKVVLLSLISIAMLSCKTQLVERSIKFNITSTSDYCGGANPPEELIADLQNPKPFTGTLYIHKDNGRVDEGVALDFKEGKSTQVGFTEGEYYIFKDKKVDMEAFHKNQDIAAKEGAIPQDINCVMMKNTMLLAKFTITPETKSITENIHFSCDPCEEPRP